MRVHIPSPLLSYTGQSEVDAEGSTLSELLLDLERRYPGIRFRVVDEQDRMRNHMRFFVNGEQVFELERTLSPADSVVLVQALSGG
jgi:molybdopterin converting factor small subunit